MQNGSWMKGLVLGIILLFFGASFFPSIRANVVELNTSSDTTYPLAIRYSFIALGNIQDKIYVGDNTYQFHANFLFYMGFVGIFLVMIHFYINKNMSVHFDKKIGIFNDEVICGVFSYRT